MNRKETIVEEGQNGKRLVRQAVKRQGPMVVGGDRAIAGKGVGVEKQGKWEVSHIGELKMQWAVQRKKQNGRKIGT